MGELFLTTGAACRQWSAPIEGPEGCCFDKASCRIENIIIKNVKFIFAYSRPMASPNEGDPC